MREIKFRAWDMIHKTMYQVFKIAFEVGNSFFVATIGDDLQCEERDERNAILMQYTGLKDKNGKEIYEGDIIRDESGEGKTRIFRIKWVSAGFVPLCNNNDEYDDVIYDIKKIEVIGNIYENPELTGNE